MLSGYAKIPGVGGIVIALIVVAAAYFETDVLREPPMEVVGGDIGDTLDTNSDSVADLRMLVEMTERATEAAGDRAQEEAEARRQAEEVNRLRAEEETRLEAEARRQAEESNRLRAKEETRLEDEAKRQAEESNRLRAEEETRLEDEAKRQAEESNRLRAEEETRLEDEAKRQAEERNRLRAEEETRLEAEAKRQAEVVARRKARVDPMAELYLVLEYTNVRSGPFTPTKKLGVLSPGAKIAVTGKVRDLNWYQVRYHDGIGYVYGTLLRKTENDEQTE